MARNIFFSLHWDRDVQRVMQIRNSSRFVPGDQVVGWYDRGVWEDARTSGAAAIQRLIDAGLRNTSVVVVCIGAETATRPWVRYEIEKGWNDGKGVIGIRIHNVSNLRGQTDIAGPNPFDDIPLQGGGRLSNYVSVYDWVVDDGRSNLGGWVEQAARDRGR